MDEIRSINKTAFEEIKYDYEQMSNLKQVIDNMV